MSLCKMLGSSQVGIMRESSQIREMGDIAGRYNAGIIAGPEMWDSSQIREMRGSSHVGLDAGIIADR